LKWSRKGYAMSDSDDNLFEVLESKATIQIIMEIGSGSQPFDNINENVLASSSTISTRLTDGVKTDLFSIEHRPTDHGTQKRYRLTENGETVLRLIQELDVDAAVRNYQRAARRYEQATTTLLSNAERHKELSEVKIAQASNDYTRQQQEIPDGVPPEAIEGDHTQQPDIEEELTGELEPINTEHADETTTEDGEEQPDSE